MSPLYNETITTVHGRIDLVVVIQTFHVVVVVQLIQRPFGQFTCRSLIYT